MAESLEAIKGGGGSIKLGTTGTISSLMTRELDHISSKKKVSSTRSKPQTPPVSVPCGSTTQKILQPRKSSVEASSSGSSKNTNRRGPSNGMSQKTKTNGRNTQRIPMLGSDKCSVDRTPVRGKNDKKILNIVEIVDIKCGNAEKAWATPLASRLKKLDRIVVLELVLMEEPTSVIWDLFLCEFESILLKYSISCITRDATVPLVPISTGGNSAISFVSRVVDLCMLCLVGVEEKAKSFDLRRKPPMMMDPRHGLCYGATHGYSWPKIPFQ
ncbi:hypothetical protein CR513_44899, partial [Mucuna pruriens]